MVTAGAALRSPPTTVGVRAPAVSLGMRNNRDTNAARRISADVDAPVSDIMPAPGANIPFYGCTLQVLRKLQSEVFQLQRTSLITAPRSATDFLFRHCWHLDKVCLSYFPSTPSCVSQPVFSTIRCPAWKGIFVTTHELDARNNEKRSCMACFFANGNQLCMRHTLALGQSARNEIAVRALRWHAEPHLLPGAALVAHHNSRRKLDS